MALATASADGIPNCRAVLLKGFDQRGFVFYTNYESRKGRELAANPRAALLFYWPELERQVRISGEVELLPREESEAYFASRPVGHQLGAWASPQSSVIGGRQELETNLAAAAKRFEPGPAPLPPYWGGYRVRPGSIEFWQGRPNRLHDRLEYVRQPNGTWIIRRLAP
jgi:pyridoxamine 5'-phosphate oxidase